MVRIKCVLSRFNSANKMHNNSEIKSADANQVLSRYDSANQLHQPAGFDGAIACLC